MNRALSYMLIGVIGATATILYIQNRDEICRKMRQFKKAGMDKINQIKAKLE